MAGLRSSLVLLAGFLFCTGTTCPAEPPDAKTSQRTDLYGDPLPEGAIARLGTVRLRHTNLILSLAYSPDSKLIASGGQDNIVCIWEANTGKEVRRLTGPQSGVWELVFSPDGKLLAAASNHQDGVVLWSVSDGKQLFRLQGICVAFTPDGENLATGCKDKQIRFWDQGTGKEVRRLAGHDNEVWCLAFSPNGATLASGSMDESARLWSVATGKTTLKLGRHEKGVHSIAFVLDGKRLGLASAGILHVYDVGTGERVCELGNPKEVVSAVLAACNGTAFATRCGGSIRLWDASAGKSLRDFSSESWSWYDSLVCHAISPNGKHLACGNRAHRICRFDLATGREVLIPHGHEQGIRDIAVAPDGKTIATASEDCTVRLWETTTGKELRVLRGHKYGLRRVAFSPDGRMLASSGRDDVVILWDSATGKELRRMPGMSVAFSPDGKILAAGGHIGEGSGTYRAGIIHIYDPATGNELQRLSGHHRPVTYVAFSPDGRLLASIEEEPVPLPGRNPPKQEPSSIRLWDVASGKEWLNFGDGRAEGPLSFSADGKTLVSCNDKTDGIHFWETATGKERRHIHFKPHAARHVAFAPDGRTFATAGEGPTIRLHAWPTGQELGRFEGRSGSVWALTYTPDGAALVSGGLDTTATVWDLNGLKRPAPQPSGDLTREQLQELWNDLARDDAGRAFRAIGTLATASGRGEAFLKEHLSPAHLDRKRLTGLIADLDSEQFQVREAATREWAELGAVAAPFLRQALKASPSAEARRRLERLLTKAIKGPLPPTQVQQLRALEALERIGTTEARQALERLTKGDPETRLTQEAKAALERLRKRQTK